ncbi:hypothetical protein ACFOY4_04920 [Actinomadura syzygii]|uniref:Uncharacterized protein n=1 Tax=Actinomadura syzygii TaxID=1427538 RepID=A0A5D0TYQ4_9ACTN|nr:hypothetical protein [Actinomadura syzygii]TYC10029.1 hypothetical protein FXF65_33590 [Actinomadura syzygii]
MLHAPVKRFATIIGSTALAVLVAFPPVCASAQQTPGHGRVAGYVRISGHNNVQRVFTQPQVNQCYPVNPIATPPVYVNNRTDRKVTVYSDQHCSGSFRIVSAQQNASFVGEIGSVRVRSD